MRMFSGRLGNERGYVGLVALLIVVAIGFLIYAMVIQPRMDSQEQKTRQQAAEHGVELNKDKTIVGASMDKGYETSCKSQLDQIRQGMTMYKTENDQNPPTLVDLKLPVANTFYQCPAAPNEPYSYDSNTGKVQCVHPGHGNL